MHLLNIWIISNNVYIEQVDSFLHKQNKEGKKREKRNKKNNNKINSKRAKHHSRCFHMTSRHCVANGAKCKCRVGSDLLLLCLERTVTDSKCLCLRRLSLLKSIKPRGVFIVYLKLLFIRGEMLEIDRKTSGKGLQT